MAVTENAYKGIRGDRFRFLMDHCPEQAKRMEREGRMDDYLDQTDRRFRLRWHELSEREEERTKRSREYQQAGWLEQLRMLQRISDTTYDQAYQEIIEAL